jgi:hypothetical protein
VREVEIVALDTFPSPHHPYGASIVHGLNRLSSAVYYLELRLVAGGGRGETSTLNPDLAGCSMPATPRPSGSGRVRSAGRLGLGVDLGTAFIVLFVVDAPASRSPGPTGRLGGARRRGRRLRRRGAIVRELKAGLEARLGQELRDRGDHLPPGGPAHRGARGPVRARERRLECTGMVDEPTAANAVLQVRDGAVVDVGGGTTGIACSGTAGWSTPRTSRPGART